MHAAVERAMAALPEASALQAATVAAIFVDKHALITGAPTARIETVGELSGNKLIEHMQQLYERMREKNAATEVVGELVSATD
jgi:glycerol-3-phosphate O-acyltransferase